MLNEDVQTTLSRPVLNHISNSLSKLNNEEAMAVGSYAIDKLAHRQLAFEDEVS